MLTQTFSWPWNPFSMVGVSALNQDRQKEKWKLGSCREWSAGQRQSQQPPTPVHPGQCRVSRHSCSEIVCEAGRAWEGDPIYLDEEHRALPREWQPGSRPLPSRPPCPPDPCSGCVSQPRPGPPGPLSSGPSASWHWRSEGRASSSCSASSESESSL